MRNQSAMVELMRVADALAALTQDVESGAVDVARFMQAERDLRHQALLAMVRVARDLDGSRALEKLWQSVDLLQRNTPQERELLIGCRAMLKKLCHWEPELEPAIWRIVRVSIELGRIAWALRLVDRVLERYGPEVAARVVERVKRNVVGPSNSTRAPDPKYNRTVQLGSKLALERIRSSDACPPALRRTVMDLLYQISKNMVRIDGPIASRPPARLAG